MAHIWVREDDGEWSMLPLGDEPVELATRPPVPSERSTSPVDRGVVVRRVCQPDGADVASKWALLTGRHASVRVNGAPVISGIRVLSDRDEIRVDGVGSVFFSTEAPARVEPYPGGDREVVCPRCRQAVEAGDTAVRCPGCNVWHHQSDELPCWSYASTCALCPRSTDLEAGFRWVPEEN